MSKNELNLEHFSENLKKLIQKNNIKNIDLANHLGLSKSAISNYISGKIPKLEIIYKIASYFDVSFDALISKNISEAKIHLNENGDLAFKLPLFNKVLNSGKIIYRKPNYFGVITLPFPVKKDLECYALRMYDDSMKNFGISNESLVVFSAATEVADGEIAAVVIKSKKRMCIRSVKYGNKKIFLCSDDKTEEFKITNNECDAIILGKVVYATFDPNNK